MSDHTPPTAAVQTATRFRSGSPDGEMSIYSVSPENATHSQEPESLETPQEEGITQHLEVTAYYPEPTPLGTSQEGTIAVPSEAALHYPELVPPGTPHEEAITLPLEATTYYLELGPQETPDEDTRALSEEATSHYPEPVPPETSQEEAIALPTETVAHSLEQVPLETPQQEAVALSSKAATQVDDHLSPQSLEDETIAPPWHSAEPGPSKRPDSGTTTSIPRGDPFATPYGSKPPSHWEYSPSQRGSRPPSQIGSWIGSATGFCSQPSHPAPRYFHSRRVVKGGVEKPWLKHRDPKEKWVTILPILGIILGFCVTGVLIWDGVKSVVNHEYCLVLDDDFSYGWNPYVWTKEVEVGGFGNGQFDMTTNTDENAFIQDGTLYIKPTLQRTWLVENNNVIDLLSDGSCTSRPLRWSDCLTGTNVTNGTIVNPVKSARINTRKGARIMYGRVEVTAKLPRGDWLWPAVWMLPVNETYGEWPRSGEIDIMESRGNDHRYQQGGNNIISSSLHWGPNADNDAWWRNNVKRKALLSTYSDDFHTFGMEWSENYIFTYVDSRLLQIMYSRFDKPLWKVGKFPLSDSNGTRLTNPWKNSGRINSPFDQEFYLIINVGVGGTNGWFEDGKSSKPWVDWSHSARRDFWNSRDEWLPTWHKQGHMEVKRVKMWQQKGYRGC